MVVKENEKEKEKAVARFNYRNGKSRESSATVSYVIRECFTTAVDARWL